jgi:uncharacterized protein (DUF2252 family)
MAAENKTGITPGRRAHALDARRNLKMASSAHAYVRGSTVQFYRWLRGHGRRAVPKGPQVWICGDCHAGILERFVVIRELMPQDLKLEMDQLSREEAVNSARYLAEVVGKAHARQMDAATRRDFASSFQQRKTARLNAPSWLWSSVVELASAHESAYLEHCRRYALSRAAH